MAKGLTPKQERFCLEYIKTGNASEAYRRAYDASRMKPETVRRRAKEMLKKGPITARIEELRKAAEDKAIASAKRIQRFWTEVMENTAEETKDRLKASELLAKAKGMFVERREVTNHLALTEDQQAILEEIRKRADAGLG